MARIRHIAIASSHPGKAAEFFKQALGLREISRFGLDPAKPDADAPRPSGVLLTDGHLNIAILKFSTDQTGVGIDYQGLHHIGVVVDDVDAWTKTLQAMGAPCIAGRDAIPKGAHFEIKFRGPDNVVFDISDSPWPGSAPVEPSELAETAERRTKVAPADQATR
jgi:catechol 2,3-dioxygenase-like lactoylglutathione lyase family enzyme